MKQGDKVKLSSLRLNDCGRLDGRPFIVVDRFPLAIPQPNCTIMYANGAKRNLNFLDCEVEYLGVGSVSITISFPREV